MHRFLISRQRTPENDAIPCQSDMLFIMCNGRPGKDPDVCYSWWVLAAWAILDEHFNIQRVVEQSQRLVQEFSLDYVPFNNQAQLCSCVQGILAFQSSQGGFRRSCYALKNRAISTSALFMDANDSEKLCSGSEPDPYHTFFALAALSLLPAELPVSPSKLGMIDPKTALPVSRYPFARS